MKISKQLLTASGIVPKIHLSNGKPPKPNGQHRVRILEDKVIKKLDATSGKELEYVRYTLEENGEKKIYDTKLRGKDNMPSYLVQRLAEIEEGNEVILEMKKQGVKNYIEVTPIGQSATVETEDIDEDEIIS